MMKNIVILIISLSYANYTLGQEEQDFEYKNSMQKGSYLVGGSFFTPPFSNNQGLGSSQLNLTPTRIRSFQVRGGYFLTNRLVAGPVVNLMYRGINRWSVFGTSQRVGYFAGMGGFFGRYHFVKRKVSFFGETNILYGLERNWHIVSDYIRNNISELSLGSGMLIPIHGGISIEAAFYYSFVRRGTRRIDRTVHSQEIELILDSRYIQRTMFTVGVQMIINRNKNVQ